MVARSADEVVVGLDDRHLDFRASLSVVARPPSGAYLVVTTVVCRHNAVGRCYFALVRVPHRLLVPRWTARAVREHSRPHSRTPDPGLSGKHDRPRSASLPHMLYGRGDDCLALSGILARAHDGASSAVVIRGEAGVGKTALVDWVAHEAAHLGMASLSCAGVESESDLAFSALHQLLRPAISAMPALPRLQQEALNGALGLSGRRGVDPFLVAVGALSLLAELAAEGGVACIIDDAQWLDPASSDVLRFVARRLDAEGIAVVFAVRDPDPATFHSPGIEEHRLPGLDGRAAGDLLRDRAPMISPEVERRLVEHHAGNPLAIIELAPLLTDAQLSGQEPLARSHAHGR